MLNWILKILKSASTELTYMYLLTQIMEHKGLLTQHLILILRGVYIYRGGQTPPIWSQWVSEWKIYKNEWKIYLATTKVANWQPPDLGKKKKGKMWKIYQSLEELSMNYPVVIVSDTLISYVTKWKWNTRCFLIMEGTWERALYNSWLLTFPSNENINMLS